MTSTTRGPVFSVRLRPDELALLDEAAHIDGMGRPAMARRLILRALGVAEAKDGRRERRKPVKAPDVAPVNKSG